MAKIIKLPPQNIEAEQSVLGALMIDKNAIINVADILIAEDFYKPAHYKVYEAILNLYEKHEPIDILSVTTKLKENESLKSIGGTTYLTELVESVPSASHVGHYAQIVKEKKILRDLISASSKIAEDAFNPTDDLGILLDDIESKIFSISQRSIPQKFTSIKEGLKEAYERIEKLHRGEGGLRGLGTGFTEIDNILSGLQKSDLVIIGARPSLGKTAMALDIARHVAVKEKQPVGIFSLEMSKEQVIDRLISVEAQLPLWELRTGRLKNDEDFELIQAALNELSNSSIYIDDTPSPNILQMRSMARRLQSEKGLSLLVVDYLQLIMPRTSSDNVVQQVTEISRGLKGLARELNVPVLALSQLSRAVDQREIKRPRLSDLRESGSIEQDADVVMFIYRKDKDRLNPTAEEENTAEIIIAKHRNGPTGSVKLKFDPEKASFRNLDKYH
ncbi:MAG: replicative DNA helicase [Parcubacteria group bacterium Athens0714_26]|nr:MAG: replicative DNA helicase [Parcubacteria group bacterium Athens0714_26]